MTREEEAMYSGEYGEATALAMKIIVKVGEVMGAEKLVKVKHVHVSGVSYYNIREPGLLFLKKIVEEGAIARAYTTVNPSSIGLCGCTELFSRELVDGQYMINSVLEKMGVRPVYTCVPYLVRTPSPGEHLAWGESNAIAMANSFYGAFTNREGGPLTIAAAITGRTYYSGLHLINNRIVEAIITPPEINDEALASLLGLYIGEYVDVKPMIAGAWKWSFLSIKEFLASTAASGSHALVVLDKITPLNTYRVSSSLEKISIDEKELKLYKDRVSESIDFKGYVLAYIGCPHTSYLELKELVNYILSYKRVRDNVDLLITIPLHYHSLLSDEIKYLVEKGVKIAGGVCPIVSVLNKKPDLVITNSGKALFYLKKLHGFRVAIASAKEIVRDVMLD